VKEEKDDLREVIREFKDVVEKPHPVSVLLCKIIHEHIRKLPESEKTKVLIQVINYLDHLLMTATFHAT